MIAASAVIAGLLASVGPSSVAAAGGAVVGPWNCGPDQTISMSFHVSGPTGSYVDGDMYYKGTGIYIGEDWIVNGFRARPGWSTYRPPSAGRTIFKFYWQGFGGATLLSWIKNCS